MEDNEEFEELDDIKDHEQENEDGLKVLTDWENEPKVTDLKQDLTDAQMSHSDHVSNVNTWLDNLNVEGTARIEKKPGRSQIVPKLIRKQAEWRYSALSEPFLNTEDMYDVSPVTWADKKAAEQNQLILNNQFNTKIKKIAFIDDYVRTAVDEGTAIVRVGWDFEEEEQEVEVEQPVYAENGNEAIAYLNQAVQQGMMPPEQAQQLLQSGQPIPVGSELVTEMQMVTVKNQPTVDVCDFNNVILDPTCKGDITKAGFVIYSFETSLSELKKDKKYHNLDKINIEANSILGEPDHNSEDDSSFNFTDKPRKKFVAYEYWGYWDIHNTGIVEPVLATWVGDTMIRLEENPFPKQFLPFILVQYLPVRKSNFGEPDGELLEDNQKIIGAVTRGMIDIMGRSANGQQGSRKDALDVTNKRKFDRGDDYEFNGAIDPRQAFHMHTFPEIPQSAQYMIDFQNNEAEALTGVKAFNQGISGQSLGSVATGIRGALDAASKRELGILRRLGEGMNAIGRMIIAMNGEFLSEEEIVRVTDDEFIPIKRDDLAGHFDLKLAISTAEADNEKAQELSFMLQTMGNNMDPAMSQMILADIAKLRKMPKLAKSIEEYEPQPDPIMEERKQLENDYLAAQTAKENSMAQENMANAAYDMARVETEKAKVRNTNADSDQKDLDFIEQETGVSRQHDMNKLEHQRETDVLNKALDAKLVEKTPQKSGGSKLQ